MDRSAEFSDGAERVRTPQFESVQQQHNRNYLATSVLDQVMPTQNGLGAQDLQRRIVGGQGSASGQAQSTFDKRLWLRTPEPAARSRRIEGNQ